MKRPLPSYVTEWFTTPPETEIDAFGCVLPDPAHYEKWDLDKRYVYTIKPYGAIYAWDTQDNHGHIIAFWNDATRRYVSDERAVPEEWRSYPFYCWFKHESGEWCLFINLPDSPIWVAEEGRAYSVEELDI